MGKLHTHYDNLQVARNASAEVISAAYRSLSFKFHPDRNNGNPRSDEMIRILNRSYAVLSDPAQRIEHDRWIMQMELAASPIWQGKTAGEQSNAPSSKSPSPPSKPTGYSRTQSPGGPLRAFVKRWGLLLAIAGIVGLVFLLPSTPPQPSGLPPYDSSLSDNSVPGQEGATAATWTLAPEETTTETALVSADQSASEIGVNYVRSAVAPNGSSWPPGAGYIKGYPLLRTGGLSIVTVDNSSNNSDVFVKLVWIGGSSTRPVRQFFIPANSEFTVSDLTSGEYDIRYKDLTDGSLARSESFSLKEIRESDGVRFSNVTMTLYKVSNGNMQTYPLAEAEF